MKSQTNTLFHYSIVSLLKFYSNVAMKPWSNSSSQRGFTIIELLIVISIVVLLTGISIAGYARLNQRQRLLASGKRLESTIIDAQSRAYNSELDCDICGCSPESASSFVGWYVDFSTREIYGQCAGNSFSAKSLDLSSDAIITPYLTPPVRLLFKNSPLRNSPTFPAQNSTICVSQENLADNFYVIRISEEGIVTNDGGLVNSCTP